MRKLLTTSLLACLFLALSPGYAGQIVHQRQILLDFNVNPFGGPPGPIPGATYTGTDDSLLWESDYVWSDPQGPIQWVRGGLLLYNNTIEPIVGWVQIHIDNWPNPNAYKNIWFEMESIQTPPYNDRVELLDLGLPVGFDWYGDYYVSENDPAGGGLVQHDAWAVVSPNPPWEDFWLQITAGPMEGVFINKVYIATDCIPAPGAIVLGSIGVGFVGWVRRRKML